jgi:hypothetical protein
MIDRLIDGADRDEDVVDEENDDGDGGEDELGLSHSKNCTPKPAALSMAQTIGYFVASSEACAPLYTWVGFGGIVCGEEWRRD